MSVKDAVHSALHDDITEEYALEDGKLIINRIQDVEPYFDANKREYNEASSWRPFAGRDMVKVASIPLVIAEKWKREEGLDVLDNSPETQKRVMAKLNSSEYLFLRTHPGRLG